MKPTVLLLAGEASGDEHGAGLAAALRDRRPELTLVGTGGPRMRSEGVELIAELDELAVMGFAEVIPRLPFFRTLRRRIEAVLDSGAVELVVPIDYPGFNLRIARSARARGCRVLYYVAPKVWAWRPGRVRTLAEVTDRVAVILPFEEAVLRAAGVRAEYVGHPLLDHPAEQADEPSFRARWGLDPERPLLAVLPGSRAQELRHHLDLFVEAADRLRAERPDVLPVLSRAPSLDPTPFERHGLPVVEGARALLAHARVALVKSGTGTLEAALEDTPMVVAYRTSAPTWMLAKALMRTEHVSLPNLIAGGPVVPEYLQGGATPSALAASLLALLDPESAARRTQLEGFHRVRRGLGVPGAAGRVANMALDLIATPA